MIPIADNQKANAAALAEANAVRLVDKAPVALEDVAAAVREFVEAPLAARETALAAARLCDGRGVYRIAAAVHPARTTDSADIHFRQVTPGDRKLLFDWQQDAEARRFARVARAPSWKEHCKWFARKIADVGCLFNIVLAGGRPVGMVRLDPTVPYAQRPAYEISILVAPEYKRRGIAKGALALAQRLVPEADIIAEVLPGNLGSQKLFRGAGYTPIGETLLISRVEAEAYNTHAH
jgi:UDP-2,4-diacetamido-2,4,6-trideoxy-beta-L-altropyranose hydrolase